MNNTQQANRKTAQNITQDLVTQDVESELDVLQVMADELEEYILDNSVYRTIFVETQSGRYRLMMSGGDMLSRLQSVRDMRANLTAAQQERLEKIERQIEQTTSSLTMPYRQLLRRELKSRLASLEWSHEDEVEEGVEEATPAEHSNYAHIALIRQELNEEETHEMREDLKKLEQRLQRALEKMGSRRS